MRLFPAGWHGFLYICWFLFCPFCCSGSWWEGFFMPSTVASQWICLNACSVFLFYPCLEFPSTLVPTDLIFSHLTDLKIMFHPCWTCISNLPVPNLFLQCSITLSNSLLRNFSSSLFSRLPSFRACALSKKTCPACFSPPLSFHAFQPTPSVP